MTANNTVESLPGGLSTPKKPSDSEQLATVFEVPRSKRGLQKEVQDYDGIFGAPPAGGSHEGSRNGSVGHIHNEKIRGQSPKRVLHRKSTARSQGRRPSTRDGSMPMQNGHVRASMADSAMLGEPKKRKKGGLGTVIRRIFGKRSVKNRISLPAPTENHYNDPHTFITSPVTEKPQRAASAPSGGVLRSSALGSHAPFAPDVPKDYRVSESKVPPQPERPPPERPARPRRASLPSVILSSKEAEDINNALTGLGLQDIETQVIDGHNIGFAVTSGSNPKRRSRSAGAYRTSAKEHRMSPIQWRQWRRRSDEIKYWRGSANSEVSPAIGGTGFEASEPLDASTNHAVGSKQVNDQDSRPFEAHNQEFNFGLPVDDIRNDDDIGEHIALEERMITLELKLMDFEFAISKLQAGSFSPVDRFHHLEPVPAIPSGHSRSVSDQPRMHNSKPAASAFVDQYPSLAYYSSDATPPSLQAPFNPSQDPSTIQPRQRPTSIATTLKASGASHQNNSPITRDRTTRNSITELTIEHYTTLITLIRREQSARMRLEDQVNELQEQVRHLTAGSPRSAGSRRREQQRYEGRHYSPDDVRRPYRLGVDEREQRGRSSNYSEEPSTDTDDDAFHEVYVTQVERGKINRESFDGEEGVAF